MGANTAPFDYTTARHMKCMTVDSGAKVFSQKLNISSKATAVGAERRAGGMTYLFVESLHAVFLPRLLLAKIITRQAKHCQTNLSVFHMQRLQKQNMSYGQRALSNKDYMETPCSAAFTGILRTDHKLEANHQETASFVVCKYLFQIDSKWPCKEDF